MGSSEKPSVEKSSVSVADRVSSNGIKAAVQ